MSLVSALLQQESGPVSDSGPAPEPSQSQEKARRPTMQRGRSAIMRKQEGRRFSVSSSTSQHHSSEDDFNFYGPYAHIRKTLDYSYHTHYRKERQWLQDSIVEDLLRDVQSSDVCTTPSEPWLIYTVGAPGAGKRHTLLQLVKEDKLHLLSFVHVDKDEIRRRLPEFGSYVKKCPELANDFTRREAAHIMEILTLAAVQSGKNVVVDGSLQNSDWYEIFWSKLRAQYPQLKIGLIDIQAPYETILQRAADVSIKTGRVIPEENIRKILDNIPASIEKLKGQVDYFCSLSNADTVELLSKGETWKSFAAQFRQTCSSIPGADEVSVASEEEKKEATKVSLLAIFRIMRRRTPQRTYRPHLSTEQNHKSSQPGFYGPYSHIRSTLDYNYHVHYTRKRQTLQDTIIANFLDCALITDKNGNVCTTPTEPWIVFTAGAMGAGKSYTMNKLVEKGRFPLLAFVHVDPDEIRRFLPEYHIYVEDSPELAGDLTRKEAGFISEILTLAALQAGKNVLVDGSLRDSEWYKAYFARLKEEFPIVRQSIIHVKAPREAVFQRAAERAKQTGRVVPKATLEMALEQVPRSVKILGPLVEYFCELNNAPGAPDIELVTEGQTWESFERNWIQTCAWVPSRRRFLKSQPRNDGLLALGGKGVN
mmetsp:Transcript_7349/g.16722  ORF Transcript_7349/g.16722 Transcript_7349/m.16722 type:complete len:650 (+) Transcript_7349:65-2014(+)